MRTIPPNQTFFIEDTIKRSRFLAHLRRCNDEESARQFIEEIRSCYPDARHNCTAFRLANPSGGPAITRSSDDGEPAGTAGMPMLEVLNGSGLVNLCCVVTRYFGGIKLGTGGLVRAYAGTVQAVLAQTPILEIKNYPSFKLDLPLSQAGKIMSLLQNNGYEILEETWADQLYLSLVHPKQDENSITAQLSSWLARTVTLTPGAIKTVEVPVELDGKTI